MNCYLHTEVPAEAYCRTCGRALCAECKRSAEGTVFCEEHLPAPAQIPAAPQPAVVSKQDASPALAAILGFLIPGVGAIYNGQYAKGLVHAIIFGLLVSITSSGESHGLEPLFGILIAVWVFYMAFEAYHTARKRRDGEPVDEFSSLFPARTVSGRFPAGAITLIVLGVVLLLDTLDVIQLRYIARYWPVLLILAGAYMLYARLSNPDDDAMNAREAGHGRD